MPEENMENNQEVGSVEQGVGGSKKWLIWTLGVILLGTVGYGGWYLGQLQNPNDNPLRQLADGGQNSNTQTPTTPAVTPTPISPTPTPPAKEPDPTADWKILSLRLTGSNIKYPPNWTIDNAVENSISTKQTIGYPINTNMENKVSEGWITEYNLSEWVKGPQPEEGYVLDKERRNSLLELIKSLYIGGKLTESLKQKFNEYSGEFMSYSSNDRVYMDSLTTKNNTAKGFSMINTHGQDLALSTKYKAVLYNRDKNSILTIEVQLTGSEIEKLQKEYGDYTSSNLEEIDKEVHRSFVDLITNTKREELSFSSQISDLNNAITSWSY